MSSYPHVAKRGGLTCPKCKFWKLSKIYIDPTDPLPHLSPLDQCQPPHHPQPLSKSLYIYIPLLSAFSLISPWTLQACLVNLYTCCFPYRYYNVACQTSIAFRSHFRNVYVAASLHQTPLSSPSFLLKPFLHFCSYITCLVLLIHCSFYNLHIRYLLHT